MIGSFRHRGLERFAKTGAMKGISPNHAQRLTKLIGQLSMAGNCRNLCDTKGFHPIKRLQGPQWSIRVSAAWRLTFDIDDNGVVQKLDYVNYH